MSKNTPAFMRKKKINNVQIYQDSKELPFCIYKKIVQTGNFFYLIKGYDPISRISVKVEVLKDKFQDIEEDYANSMNMRNADVTIYGEIAIATNEFNKYNIILLFVEQAIRAQELRLKLQELLQDLKDQGQKEDVDHINMLLALSSTEHSDFDSSDIKELLNDFKVQKSDDLYKQRQFIQNKLDKLNNQILKLNSQIETKNADQDNSEFDIEEQFVSVCLGLELPVDDTKISLYQYGIMVKALIKRVEELNKLKSHVR